MVHSNNSITATTTKVDSSFNLLILDILHLIYIYIYFALIFYFPFSYVCFFFLLTFDVKQQQANSLLRKIKKNILIIINKIKTLIA